MPGPSEGFRGAPAGGVDRRPVGQALARWRGDLGEPFEVVESTVLERNLSKFIQNVQFQCMARVATWDRVRVSGDRTSGVFIPLVRSHHRDPA